MQSSHPMGRHRRVRRALMPRATQPAAPTEVAMQAPKVVMSAAAAAATTVSAGCGRGAGAARPQSPALSHTVTLIDLSKHSLWEPLAILSSKVPFARKGCKGDCSDEFIDVAFYPKICSCQMQQSAGQVLLAVIPVPATCACTHSHDRLLSGHASSDSTQVYHA